MPTLPNEPFRIIVDVDGSHQPAVVIRFGQRVPVEQILDAWIISAASLGPVAELDRRYFSVQLMDGVRFTIYHDRVVDAWFELAS